VEARHSEAGPLFRAALLALCSLHSRAATGPSQFPSHSRAFGGVRDHPPSSVVPGHERPRPVPNGRQQTWKACWGNPQEFESLILRQCSELRK
jgi:hypothetical protein